MYKERETDQGTWRHQTSEEKATLEVNPLASDTPAEAMWIRKPGQSFLTSLTRTSREK